MKLAKYLAEHVERNFHIHMSDRTVEEVIQEGIEAFQLAEGCKLAAIDNGHIHLIEGGD